jgi:hypothetical protein
MIAPFARTAPFAAILTGAALFLGTPQAAIAQQPTASSAQGQSAMQRPPAALEVVQRAAEAMGGAQKIVDIRNIIATGYGQYAYQWGGGRIDGSLQAPEKYIAANELVRVYDLENSRFQMRERRNMLFPFLARFGHAWTPNNWVLDDDVAYNISDQGAARAPDRMEGALWNDGIHMRRMWMMNNPVVLMQRLMDPATRLSAPYGDGENTVVDVVLAEGDRLSAGFSPSGLPTFVRWGNWHANLGQVNMTTWFSGWVTWDGEGGVQMPLGYSTRLDWRDVNYFKMYIDGYKVNTEIPDLEAPAEVEAAVVEQQPLNLTHVDIADGIWRISNGTTVLEFADHLVIYELGRNPIEAAQILDYARSLAPGKPIRYLVISHNHFDHTAGVRQAVAEGLTIIGRPSSIQQMREMAEHPAPDYPDELALNSQPFRAIEVEEHLRLQDETQVLDLYWGRNNPHMSDIIFGYVPSAKLMIEGDMVTAAYDFVHWPDTLRDVISYYDLDVEIISPVHTMSEISPDLLTLDQAEELLSGGVQRAREHCAEKLEDANYWPGCPVQTKHY